MKFRFTHTKQLSVSIERELINDARLTYADKGVALILCALPPEKEFSLPEVAKNSKGGVQGLKSSIKRLESYGYVSYTNGILSIKGHGGKDVPKHVEVRKAKKTKTREEHIQDRTDEKRIFQEEMKEVLQTMKPPIPSDDTAREFFRFWTAMDIDPSIPLPYIKARRKTGNFNMVLRLRTWMKREKERNQKDRL